jgi:hypothetical protein
VNRGEEADTLCVCRDGFTGNPDSEVGCSSRLTAATPTSPASTNASNATSPSSSPSDVSTTASVLSASEALCLTKNGSYSAGEEWFDGCELRCSCGDKGEILCQPRCRALPAGPPEGTSKESCKASSTI